jgi:hypothetical protein
VETSAQRLSVDPTAPRYPADAVARLARIGDLAPRRYRTLFFSVTLLGLLVAALEGAYWYSLPLAAVLGYEALAPLDLAARGSLASWLSAALLLSAAAVCGVIYSIRRHRIDDYRARYRTWLWGAVAAVLASVDSVARIHDTFAGLMVYETGWGGTHGAAIWRLGGAALVIGLPTMRCLLDVRGCRVAMGFLLTAAAAWGGALSVELGVWTIAPTEALMIQTATLLAGHILLLAGLGAYARFVVLDADNLLPRGPAKAQRKPKRKATATDDLGAVATKGPAEKPARVRIDPPHSSKPRPAGESTRTGQSDDADEDRPNKSTKRRSRSDDDGNRWVDGRSGAKDAYEQDETSSSFHKLSKTERKRLRKLKTAQRD